MEEAIAIIIAIIVILISNWRISKWKKEAATAYFIIGQKAISSEEREWAYRKAFKYGHTKAKLFYIYAAANTFSGRKPLTPFIITRTKAKSPLSPYSTTIISAPNISRTRVTSNKKSPKEFWNSKMVSTPHQIYTQKFCEHLKPISTRIGKLHKDQPSSLCPAAANRPTLIVSPHLPGA